MKICVLLDDPERRRSMGALGRQRIEAELAWHHQVPPLLTAYETALIQGNTTKGQKNR
jgi:hypothetical protein